MNFNLEKYVFFPPQAELQALDGRTKDLERVIERGSRETVDPAMDETLDEEGEGPCMYCVTCGHEVRLFFLWP